MKPKELKEYTKMLFGPPEKAKKPDYRKCINCRYFLHRDKTIEKRHICTKSNTFITIEPMNRNICLDYEWILDGCNVVVVVQ